MTTVALCQLCGEPMPVGEEMFKFHGYSGPCPKPPLPSRDIKQPPAIGQLDAALQAFREGEITLGRMREIIRDWLSGEPYVLPEPAPASAATEAVTLETTAAKRKDLDDQVDRICHGDMPSRWTNHIAILTAYRRLRRDFDLLLANAAKAGEVRQGEIVAGIDKMIEEQTDSLTRECMRKALLQIKAALASGAWRGTQ